MPESKFLDTAPFPNAVEVTHKMDGHVIIREGAEYSYFERHVHSESGGTNIIPYAKVDVGKNARFKNRI